jgi:BirA family transcriptional regulator, biotin operon repressor / biotin---[acetyl-CoA-carboxylase] ligase
LTGSTNADLLERAKQGAPEGLWLRADAQQSGKGRMGRQWDSQTGNLLASTIIRLLPSDPAATSLAFVAAVAAHKAVSKLSPFAIAQIKWPNDLLSLDGKKFCGILLERADSAVVAGIGVNLAYHPEGLDRPVTSIAALGLVVPSPQEFLEILAADFAATLLQWRTYGAVGIFNDWLQRAHPIGSLIAGQLPNSEVFEGAFDGLSDDGALMLRLADGSIRVIHAGDVFLV